MNIERSVRLIAGVFVLISLALGYWLSLLVFVHRLRRLEPLPVGVY